MTATEIMGAGRAGWDVKYANYIFISLKNSIKVNGRGEKEYIFKNRSIGFSQDFFQFLGTSQS